MFDAWLVSHYVVFLGKILYSCITCLHPGVLQGTSKMSGKPQKFYQVTLAWSRGEGLEILTMRMKCLTQEHTSVNHSDCWIKVSKLLITMLSDLVMITSYV